jgi:hypothetical protein
MRPAMAVMIAIVVIAPRPMVVMIAVVIAVVVIAPCPIIPVAMVVVMAVLVVNVVVFLVRAGATRRRA